MKTIIFAVMLAVWSLAGAENLPDAQQVCLEMASVQKIAAEDRDAGQPPQVALDHTMLVVARQDQLQVNNNKHMVNLIYFQPGWQLSGDILFERTYRTCLYPTKSYEPLK
jgi:hypothetical protein